MVWKEYMNTRSQDLEPFYHDAGQWYWYDPKKIINSLFTDNSSSIILSQGEYSLVPIRKEDRYDIMKWRNEQIYHLRQTKLLTKEEQDEYFDTVIARLYNAEKPDQLLFSYLRGNECIGYGGLVHINWIDRNAEVSFIMDTKLEKDEFHKHWGIFLDLLFQIAFEELKLHKIYTYAYDLRPHLYEAIEAKGFVREATLKEHCLFQEKYTDVVIHSIINIYDTRVIS